MHINSLLSAPSVFQIELSCTLNTHMFNLLLEAFSTADRARLLSVSSPHASFRLSVVPSHGLGLHLDPQAAMMVWIHPMGPSVHFTPLYPLGHHAITCKHGGDVVARHNTPCDVLAETCHWTHLGVQVEAGNDLMANHSHTHPADLLLINWATGKTAAFDISVTSQLNTHTLMEVGVSAGYAALATEGRKHRVNDAKCGEHGWLCIPLVAET